MNIPPVFARVNGNPAAKAALLKPDGIVSLFYGVAPQSAVTPYAVWQVLSGVPDIVYSGSEPSTRIAVQIDVYDVAISGSIAVADAVHDALAESVHRTRFDVQREPDTDLMRVSMDYDFLV